MKHIYFDGTLYKLFNASHASLVLETYSPIKTSIYPAFSYSNKGIC